MVKTQNHRNSIGQWLAVGGSWRLAWVGGWRLVGWRLALKAVLNKKKLGLLRTALPSHEPHPIPAPVPPPLEGLRGDTPG